MDMKTIILLLIIAFAIFIAFVIKYYCKRNEKSALIPIILEIFITIFTVIPSLYGAEIKGFLPPFSNSSKSVSSTESTSEPTTEPSITTEPLTTVNPSKNTTNSNNIISIHNGNTYIFGNSVNANLSSKNSELFVKYKPHTTGKYQLNFDISNKRNKYSITVIDANNKAIANSYLPNDSLTLELTQNEEYTIVITETTYTENFNVYIKLNIL